MKPENFAGAGDMMDTIYQANKKRDREIALRVKQRFDVSALLLLDVSTGVRILVRGGEGGGWGGNKT